MSICSLCGNEFDKDEAEDIFTDEYSILSYSRFKSSLCGACAVEVIEDLVEGHYFENCERCGKRFDYVEEYGRFNSAFPWYNGTTLTDHWDSEILCADCALDDIESSE